MSKTIDASQKQEIIAPVMRTALKELSSLVERLAGDRLVGLTAFGAVLEPDFDYERLTAQSVLVLKDTDLGLLRQLAEYGPQLGARHVAAPLVMTQGYISASLDTFPLEFAEIVQRRATLAGRDCFGDLQINSEHLRLQCEREFKLILIRLRQAVLAAGTREQVLGDIQFELGRQLLRTLRGTLWLSGKQTWAGSQQVLADAEQWAGTRLDGVRSAIRSPGGLGWPDFQSFYHDVEKLAEKADAL